MDGMITAFDHWENERGRLTAHFCCIAGVSTLLLEQRQVVAILADPEHYPYSGRDLERIKHAQDALTAPQAKVA